MSLVRFAWFSDNRHRIVDLTLRTMIPAQVVGDPVRISICHCVACQRRTSCVFTQQARFRRDNHSLSGVSSEYARACDKGFRIRFQFCPHCSSTVSYEPGGLDECFVIPGGVFAVQASAMALSSR